MNDDLLVALTSMITPTAGDDSYKTVRQLSQDLNIRLGKVRELIRILADENRLEVSQITSQSIDGRVIPVPAYRLKGMEVGK